MPPQTFFDPNLFLVLFECRKHFSNFFSMKVPTLRKNSSLILYVVWMDFLAKSRGGIQGYTYVSWIFSYE